MPAVFVFGGVLAVVGWGVYLMTGKKKTAFTEEELSETKRKK